jgi:hypothetical protein
VRRIAGLAALAALVLAAPAHAVAPGPTVRDFESQAVGTPMAQVYPGEDVSFYSDPQEDCRDDQIFSPGGNLGPNYLNAGCPEFIGVRFLRSPQAWVGLYYRIGPNFFQQSRFQAVAYSGNNVVDQFALEPVRVVEQWLPLILADPRGVASIDRVELFTTHFTDGLRLDDLGYSTVPQPDTEIMAGPPARTTAREALFTFQANQPGTTFNCTLDGVELPVCPSSPLTGLALGSHTFTVAAVDRWGSLDTTPAVYTWMIDPDADGDGVTDVSDNCPSAANSDQADGDADGIGNVCEVLPPGNIPARAGVTTTVRLISGEVFVKLPAGAAASDLRTLRAPFQETGFLPLKGVASIPVGSVVDARKGQLALTSALNSRPVGDRRRRLQSATFAAGMFRIRQARLRRASSRRIATRAVLVSGAGAERVCARRARAGQPRGIVRSLSVSGKGLFRTVGGASKGTARNATWITSDRCNGTLTEVGRGRVTLRDIRRKRTVTVPAGRAYLARARLFTVRKGRFGNPRG